MATLDTHFLLFLCRPGDLRDSSCMDTDSILEILAQKLRATETRLDSTERSDAQLWAAIGVLLDVCQHHGVTTEGHRALIAKLRERTPVGKPKIRLAVFDDKYETRNSEIDCESRLHLCQARCCSFAVELSRQDLEERTLEWDIDEPYVLARADDGYCAYLERTTGGCTAYDHRPSTCRRYNCRRDSRVWLDFEKRVPAPVPIGVLPLSLRTITNT